MITAVEKRLYEKRTARFLRDFEQYIVQEWGRRCHETDKDCPLCDMWRLYDEVRLKVT